MSKNYIDVDYNGIWRLPYHRRKRFGGNQRRLACASYASLVMPIASPLRWPTRAVLSRSEICRPRRQVWDGFAPVNFERQAEQLGRVSQSNNQQGSQITDAEPVGRSLPLQTFGAVGWPFNFRPNGRRPALIMSASPRSLRRCYQVRPALP